jgi:RHS repeat-associated protein
MSITRWHVIVAVTSVVGLGWLSALLLAGALSAISPAGASTGTILGVTGSGFAADASLNQVIFSQADGTRATAVGESITTLDATSGRRRLNVRVPAGLGVGRTSVAVRNSGTGEMSTGVSFDLLRIELPETKSAIRGASGVKVRVTGSPNLAFVAGKTSVIFSPPIPVTSVTVESPRSLVATIDVPATALPGARTIATRTSTQSAQLENAFTITEAPTNRAPTSRPGGPYSGVAGQATTFNGEASSDPDGDALIYTWTFGDGSSGSGATTTHTYKEAGTFTVTLTVNDERGGQHTAGTTATVVNPNSPPVANAGGPYVAIVGQVVNFDGSGSTDADRDPLTFAWQFGDGSTGVGDKPTHAYAAVGEFVVIVTVSDGRSTHAAQTTVKVSAKPADPNLPPDPATVAPPLDATSTTNLRGATEFLYAGPNPIQAGVVPGTIDAVRAAVVRGRLLSANGEPLPDATVRVLNHPEWGSTRTRADGMFDMAVNGGGSLTLEYMKPSYLPIQRQLSVPWRDYVWVPDAVMLALDNQVTAIDMAPLTTAQVARGSRVQDQSGTRQATLIFPEGGTVANVELSNGTVLPAVSQLSIRATEYTLGPNGLDAMPAVLPPSSGYTYAVELSADEAMALGARSVRFNRPVPFYVENFLAFPVGSAVPTGYYDRQKAVWVPADNGRVIRILDVVAGSAIVDTTGNGLPASPAEVTTLGFTPGELRQLGALYQAGQSLWRVPISHFTPFDMNWPLVPEPPDAGPPRLPNLDDLPENKRNLKDPCLGEGSVIECENQVLGESVRVAGIGSTLNYSSDRVPGRVTNYTLSIPVFSAVIPAGVQSAELEIYVAGQRLTRTFAATPGQTHTFVWDGRDGYGRRVMGVQPVLVRVGYAYRASYRPPVGLPRSFSRFPSSAVRLTDARTEILIWQEFTTALGSWDARSQGLGGWTLSRHHAYDPFARVLHRGDGSRQAASNAQGYVVRPFKDMNAGSFAMGPDGSLYFSFNSNQVSRLSPNGITTVVAGNGQSTCGGQARPENDPCWLAGDGGPATDAQFSSFSLSVATAPDGSLYIGEGFGGLIRRVSPGGIISTVAGCTGSRCDPSWQEGGPANRVRLITNGGVPPPMAVAPDGTVYVSAWIINANSQVVASLVAVHTDGTLTFVGGTGPLGSDNVPVRQASFSSPGSMAFAADGTLYIATGFSGIIAKITPDGMLRRVAGGGPVACGQGEGGPASALSLCDLRDIAVGADGSIYYIDQARIRRISSSGIVTTIGGTGVFGFTGNGGPALSAQFSPFSIGLSPDGSIYVGEIGRVRVLSPAFPGFALDEILIASESGGEIFRFDSSGRHLQTIHALTGSVLEQFVYDRGLLVGIRDGFNNIISVERDATGIPLAIVSPFGHRTSLATDADGYLTTITDGAAITRLSYSPGGSLTALVSPNGFTYQFGYDELGRLIRDQDPAGGVQVLSRSDAPNGSTVTKSSALGVTTSYKVEQTATGDERRVNTFPNGSSSTRLLSPDGTSTLELPDNTRIVARFQPDRRFGMQAPVASETRMATPHGLNAITANARTLSLANPNDPMSLSALTDITTVNGRQYVATYDAASRTITSTSAAGRATRTILNLQGQPTRIELPALAPIDLSYDSRGRLSSTSQSGRTFAFSYGADGMVTAIRDPEGRLSEFQRDTSGRVVTQTLPGGRVIRYTYDAGGNITSITPPGRTPHNFDFTEVDLVSAYEPPSIGTTSATQLSYDLDRQLGSITRPDKQSVRFSYDNSARLQSVTSAAGPVVYTYDPMTGHVASIAAPSGVTVTHQYDSSLLTQTAWSGAIGGTVDRTYDNNFQVVSERVNGGHTAEFSYDADGLLTAAGALSISRDPQHGLLVGTTLGGLTDRFTYSSLGELVASEASFNGNSLMSTQYTRDNLGRVTQKTEHLGIIVTSYTYVYDVAGRLVQVHKNGVAAAQYRYDANGNRTSYLGSSGAKVATYDAQDRLLTYGAEAFSFGASGELQVRTNALTNENTRYTYDGFGNLTNVLLPDGKQIGYLIDGQNRRVAKTVGGSIVQAFLYEGQLRPVAELDSSGNVVTRFIYGTRVNVPDYMIRFGIQYKFVTDHLGSPRLLVNSSTGAVVQQLEYDEFGNVIVDTNPGFQPFAFAGGLYEPATRLLRFGTRDYSPDLGRWMSKDQIGFSGGDANLYGYVLGDPVNLVDPDGLSASCANCVDKCLKDNYGNLADYAFNASLFGLTSVAGLQLAAYSGGLKFGVLGGAGLGAEAASQALAARGSAVLSSPTSNFGQYFGLQARATAAQSLYSAAEGFRSLSSVAFKAARALGVAGAVATVAGTSFYGTAWVYCSLDCRK